VKLPVLIYGYGSAIGEVPQTGLAEEFGESAHSNAAVRMRVVFIVIDSLKFSFGMTRKKNLPPIRSA
jgi:hypothetical protein